MEYLSVLEEGTLWTSQEPTGSLQTILNSLSGGRPMSAMQRKQPNDVL